MVPVNSMVKRNKITDILIGILVAVPIVFIAIICVLISPVLWLLNRDNREFNKKYKLYLRSIEGEKFFCYTNKKITRRFVESQILPHISDDINIIFLEGQKVNTQYDKDFMKRAVWGKSLPCFMKVCNGKMAYRSIARELLDAVYGRIEVNELVSILMKQLESLK